MVGLSLLVIVILLGLPLPLSAANSTPTKTNEFLCGTTATTAAEQLAISQYHLSRQPKALSVNPPAISRDRGHVAILEDDGTLITKPNALDVSNKSIVFTPVGTDKFSVAAESGAFEEDSANATALTLDDDDSESVTLPFSFSFYGRSYTSVFVNTDGNLTFTQADSASTERNFTRITTGPPRIAPLLNDLNPVSPGRITVDRRSDRMLVTWTTVGEWTSGGSTGQNTFQVILRSNGVIRFNYQRLDANSGVVAIGPGSSAGAANSIIDLSEQAVGTTLSGVIAEIFAASLTLDLTQISQAFFRTHPDAYDGLFVFADFSLNLGGGTFAFATPVRNDIRGIRTRGSSTYDYSAAYGSTQRLAVVMNMGDISRYPQNPLQPIFREENGLSILAHEFGHRWLSFVDAGSPSLLGRDNSHWSFLHNTSGSFMEGNDISDLGGGRFQTGKASVRYSALDQYLMGLRPASEVPPWFVVASPSLVAPIPAGFPTSCRTASRMAACAPYTGVEFTGTRREVTIEDVVAVAGARTPDFAQAQKDFRVAFILVTTRGKAAREESLETIENFYAHFPSFFGNAVEGRAKLTAELLSIPAGTTQIRTEITSNASRRIETSGTDATTQVGYATLDAAVGMSVIRFTSGADIRSEAAIPAATLGTSFRIYAERNSQSSTGIALLNTSQTSAANVTARLSNGSEIVIQLPPRGQKSQFIDELFSSVGTAFVGTLTLTSNVPVGVVALRGTLNERNEFLITTVPASTGAVSAETTVFPQVADGSGYATELILLNPAASAIRGSLEFSFNVTTDRGTNTTFSYDIPAGGVWKMKTSGVRSDVQVGFASIVPAAGSSAPVSSAVLKQTSGTNLNFEAGVPAARPVTNGIMFGVNNAMHRSVLAVANRGGAAASLRLTAYRNSGSLAAPARTISLSSNQHAARFLDELITDLPSDFDGTVVLEATAPVYVITLRTLVNQSGAFLMTAMPVIDLNQIPPTTSYFPQLVDGGNFSTEFLLLNTTAATAHLQFFNLQGEALPVPIR